jgi:hypothetical protein
VDQHVRLQIRASLALLLTNKAFEAFCVAMNHLMLRHFSAGLESFLANLALVILFPIVLMQEMLLQIRIRPAFFAANLTLEIFRTTVDQFMNIQICLQVKLFITILTLKQFFASVNDSVSSQIIFGFEVFVT